VRTRPLLGHNQSGNLFPTPHSRFEGDEVVEEPVEQELRARILELRGQGLGAKKIAARLNEESAGNPRTGRDWHYGTMAATVRNARG